MSMPGRGEGVNLNVRMRTDARPEQLLKEIALSPLIYIRLLGILFSIVVFGCVSDQLLNVDIGALTNICGYNGSSACSFSIAVGAIAFLLCLAFIVKDILYVVIDYSDSPVIKKVLLLVDAVANGFWGFMWFVCFCYTADQLRQNVVPLNTNQRNCANAGVAFSFFSVLAWGAIVGINVFYFVRLQFSSKDGYTAPGTGTTGPSGYTSFPGDTDQPAAADDEDEHRKQYAPPEY